jgi:SAM-dependent methyltransferase
LPSADGDERFAGTNPEAKEGVQMGSEKVATRADHDKVYQMIMASFQSQVVRTLALLSAAEHLQASALTAGEIAERESSDPDMTYRVLRAGASLGFLNYDRDTKQFVGTPLLDVLREDSPLSLKYYAQIAPSRAFWPTTLMLPETVREGKTHVVDALGSTVFEYFAEHEDQARMFSAAMTNLSTPVIREAVAAIDTRDARLAVDVGGANGAFIVELLQRNPELQGTVLDLPRVIPGVLEAANAHGLEERMTGIAGDFFEKIPPADIYLLKFVLHDWDDESCIKILSNIRDAMKPGGRLFIVEMIVSDDNSLSATLMDMGMLTSFTGQERELPQFERLLLSAELKIREAVSLHPPYQLIEARA